MCSQNCCQWLRVCQCTLNLSLFVRDVTMCAAYQCMYLLCTDLGNDYLILSITCAAIICFILGSRMYCLLYWVGLPIMTIATIVIMISKSTIPCQLIHLQYATTLLVLVNPSIQVVLVSNCTQTLDVCEQLCRSRG